MRWGMLVLILWADFRQHLYVSWSRLTCQPPGDLPNPGVKSESLMCPAVAGRFFTSSATWEAPYVSSLGKISFFHVMAWILLTRPSAMREFETHYKNHVIENVTNLTSTHTHTHTPKSLKKHNFKGFILQMYSHRLLIEVISESESRSLRVFSHKAEESRLKLHLASSCSELWASLGSSSGWMPFFPTRSAILWWGENSLLLITQDSLCCFLFSPLLNPVFAFLCGGTSGKQPTYQCRRYKRCGFNPWVKKIPWRRAWQPTPVFLPGEPHGQRSLVGYSA